MKKIKQVFPSRNYITVDSYGDVEVIFNPVGDGFEGDDKLMFRKGRWAFRVNDFLSGKVMADGSKEGMGRKVYSLNLVYDDEDGEPIVNTTYVDPTSVIPLDGSVVDVVGSEKLAQKDLQEKILSGLEDWLFGGNQDSGYYSVGESLNSLYDCTVDMNQKVATFAKQEEIKNILDTISSYLHYENSDGDFKGIYDLLDDVRFNQVNIDSLRFKSRSVALESIGGNKRYLSGTVFYFGTNHFISLRSDCITVSVGSDFLLLGDMSEYNNGTVKRLDGVKFAQSDVTKIVS